MAYSDIKQLDDAYNKLAGVIIQFYDMLIIIFVYNQSILLIYV